MKLELALVAISISVLAYGLISNKSESHSVTAPMVFVTIGLLGHIFGLAKVDLSHGFIHGFLEITLILVLFSDASRINLKLLMKQHGLPLRMLLIGMPLFSPRQMPL
jgi:sodium/hydrogen antiporter